jgi:SNF2 family DNA or RNA helicase
VPDTPLQVVEKYYGFPFELRKYQVDAVNELAPLDRTGMWAEVGVGKTPMATAIALYKNIQQPKTQTIVLMPPILITQWKRWLESVDGIKRVLAYRGTPKERLEIKFKGFQFILMSIQIFKKDYIRLCDEFTEAMPLVLIVDEATSIKNSASDNHKAVRDFVNARGATLSLLTGTPLSTPNDAYGYIKLLAPSVYRNKRHFDSLHVLERDYFENVVQWGNLDLLADNLMVNSVRILKEEVLPDLKQPIYVPIRYELDRAHMKLYRTLAEEQLLLLGDGGKIDATTAPRLYNALQQIVVNWAYFSGDPGDKSQSFALVDAVMDEVGSDKNDQGKLMIFSNYRMTNRALTEYLAPYGAVAFYSEVSQKQQGINLQRFVEDPTCRVAIAQPQSAGYGLDALQYVCWDMLFLEAPIIPKDFTQAVGRIYRLGQKKPPTIRIGVAEGTIQVRLHEQLLAKDELVNKVQGGWKDLRDAIYGE